MGSYKKTIKKINKHTKTETHRLNNVQKRQKLVHLETNICKTPTHNTTNNKITLEILFYYIVAIQKRKKHKIKNIL